MAASYNVWNRDANNLWKGGTPREEVDSLTGYVACRQTEKSKIKTTSGKKEK
jgi:uncharacterized protein (DUF427 family)